MAGIFLGSTPLTPAMLNGVSEVYVGSTKVWPSGPPPLPTIDMTNLDAWWNANTYEPGVNTNILNATGNAGSCQFYGDNPKTEDGLGIIFDGLTGYGIPIGNSNYNTFGASETHEFIAWGTPLSDLFYTHRGGNNGYWFGMGTYTIGGLADVSVALTGNMNPSAWNIITFVLNSNTLRCFVNGVFIKQLIITTGRVAPTGTDTATIARFRSNKGELGAFIACTWADTKLYHNRAMSDAQVLANFNAQKDYYGIV